MARERSAIWWDIHITRGVCQIDHSGDQLCCFCGCWGLLVRFPGKPGPGHYSICRHLGGTRACDACVAETRWLSSECWLWVTQGAGAGGIGALSRRSCFSASSLGHRASVACFFRHPACLGHKASVAAVRPAGAALSQAGCGCQPRIAREVPPHQLHGFPGWACLAC